MKNLIFVENTNVLKSLEKMIPDDFILIPMEELFGTNDFCEDIFNDNVLNKIDKIKDLVVGAESIFIVYTENSFEYHYTITKTIEVLSINRFFKVEIYNFDTSNVQKSFEESVDIKEDEINYMLAKLKIDKIVNCDFCKIVKWFFLKENLLEKDIAEKIKISRSILYALDVFVKNEDKIDNFIAGTYNKVGVDYTIDRKPFRVKNQLKFNEDMQEELNVFYSEVSDKRNEHIVEKFEAGTRTYSSPKPFNTLSLQTRCNSRFGFDAKDIIKVAKELHKGIEIDGKLVSLITPVQTKNTYISQEKRFEISQYIMNIFGEEYQYMGDRDYINNIPDDNKEAIIPNFFTNEYNPTTLQDLFLEKYSQMHFLIYEYIFERTIASMMKSMIIDASEVVVKVGDNKFRAVASKIKENEEGWYIIGKYWDEVQLSGEEIDLPMDLYPGQVIKQFCTGAMIYPVQERTPMRYGEARFMEKASKEITVEEEEITYLLDIMKKQEFIKVYNRTIHPMTLGRRVYYFFQEYLPDIIDVDLIEDTNIQLKKIKEGKLEKIVLINKYKELLSKLKDACSYTNKSYVPDEWEKEKAMKIAKQNNQDLNPLLLNSKKLLNEYIVQNDKDIEKLGICIECKCGEIYEKGKGFFCDNKECNFVVWKKGIHNFFERRGKLVEEFNYKNYIKLILEKEQCLVREFYSKKKQDYYDAKVTLKYNEEYKNWNLAFVFEEFNKNNTTNTNSNEKETLRPVEDHSIEREDIANFTDQESFSKLGKEIEWIETTNNPYCLIAISFENATQYALKEFLNSLNEIKKDLGIKSATVYAGLIYASLYDNNIENIQIKLNNLNNMFEKYSISIGAAIRMFGDTKDTLFDKALNYSIESKKNESKIEIGD